eukprot:CAMPEP_0201676898 /NCGR_PEP_ID=MMETSP0494-20130426/42862_1 /ASSEMBLY_ACC=CAM_ASM_000839 /TAXON_ID=420259 /ORGANISM="Thalassiosira gravida, Strain GMp14c1" /LENGTH=349 /DNA_ID=CAMNT_0048159719 /DNA_START=22 /DNA_END=1071 /DNA_ORIENTATION=-
MATSAASSPRRRICSADLDAENHLLGGTPISRANRSPTRLDSSEIPRTYSGLYGAGAPPMPDNQNDEALENDSDKFGNSIPSPPRVKLSVFPSHVHHHKHHHHHHQAAESNLLPFELSRNRNTDWIAAGGPALLATYISGILIFLLTFLAFVTEPKVAWTMSNVTHGLMTTIYLHWIKGNPADFMDGTQGEMNAMTCWEQIVCKPANHLHDAPPPPVKNTYLNVESPTRSLRESMTVAVKKLRSRDVLCVVPTLLALASINIAKFQFEYVFINVGTWAVVMLPKIPLMNGVRILGINRTAGIDDGDYREEDDCFDTEEESSNEGGVGMDFAAVEGGIGDKATDESKKGR